MRSCCLELNVSVYIVSSHFENVDIMRGLRSNIAFWRGVVERALGECFEGFDWKLMCRCCLHDFAKQHMNFV